MNTAHTSPRANIPLGLTFFLTVLGMATLFALSKPLAMADLGVYLRMGTWMLEHQRLLTHEPFSLAVLDMPFQNGTWASQGVFALLFKLGGYPAIQMLLASAVGLTLVVTGLHIRSATSASWMGAGALLAFFALLQNLAIRPQTFSLVGFALTWMLLERRPTWKATPALLFLIFVLWANLHGAFPVTFAIPAAFGLEALARAYSPLPGDKVVPPALAASFSRWGVLGACMVAGSLFNPDGPKLYLYIMENSSMPATRGLDEWLAPTPLSFMGGRLYLALLVLAWIGWKARAHLRLGELLLVGIYGVLALGSVRMIVWFGLVAAVVGLRWGWACRQANPPPPPVPDPGAARLHTGLGIGVLALFALLFVKSWPGDADAKGPDGDYPNLDPETPVKVATWLEAHPGGRTFCRFEWGSYFLWRLWPQTQPFLDIRLWQYDDALWQTYLETGQGRGDWEAVLSRFQLQTLVLSVETQSGLIQAAQQNPAWKETYRDASAVVFTRAGAPEGSP